MAKQKSNMPVVYVAGPFRAQIAYDIEQNIRAAEALGLEVCRMGGVAVVPHTQYRFFQGALPDEFWLEATLELLRRCDAIVLLPTWQKSSGARGEHDEAVRLNLPVFHAGYGEPVRHDSGLPLSVWINEWLGGGCGGSER